MNKKKKFPIPHGSYFHPSGDIYRKHHDSPSRTAWLLRVQVSRLVRRLASTILRWGFPGGASGKEPSCQCRRLKRSQLDLWVGKIPWRRAWQPTPVFLPGESHGHRHLVGYSPGGCKESDTTERLTHTDISLLDPNAWCPVCNFVILFSPSF